MISTRWIILAGALALLGTGCGYSEEEWQRQLKKYEELASAHKSLEAELAAARKRTKQLEQELEKAGYDLSKLNDDLASRETELSKLSSTLEERQRALEEYKRRAEQLERIKERFELLRKKLEALTSLGLEVKIRNNRMIISLPGDVLFDAGRDSLKTDGKDVLDKVAGIITGDSSLKARQYQVAGHTDTDEVYGGCFGDNWGLSLLRARTVLLHLIKKGNVPPTQWSAAGFGSTDPVADNESPEGKQKNRRCEIIVVPSAEEMLDLKAITG